MQVNESLRNIGILAHVDAGKTTVTEQMLFLSGQIRSPGSVDDGTAHTDRLDVERSRGISVRAAVTSFPYEGVRVNLVDTPGHVDFTAEVERSLRVLDGAILIVPAVEGIQAQAEALWQALRTLKIPTLLFINKLDRAGADEMRVLDQLKAGFSARIFPIQRVTRSLDGFSIAPVWSYGSDEPAPEDAVAAAAEADDALLERYLSGSPVACRALDERIAAATRASALFPALYGSAIRGAGIEDLIRAVIRYLPAPEAPEEAPLSGVVFQVEHDRAMGKIAHVRLYGGTLRNRDAVAPANREGGGKVTQIRRMGADRWKDTGMLAAGDIASVCGLGFVKAGDILGECPDAARGVTLAVPLLRVQALPPDEAAYSRLIEALQELADEDPALDLQWLREERELHVSVMGKIQLEVLQALLRDRYGLAVTFGRPSVIYRETPSAHGFGHAEYTMPKPCWAILDFEIEPLPRGSGLQYSSVVRDDRIFYRYQEHVRKTVPEALKQGLYGWEVTDLRVTLIGGEHHTVHTHPMDFFTATPMGIMDGLARCGTTLLEPLLTYRISAPEEYGGKLIRDVLDMRGSFDSPVIKAGIFTMETLVPVATSLDYAARLGAMTSGRGHLTARFSGYRECPPELGATTPYRGVNPLDRERYILKIRGAIK